MVKTTLVTDAPAIEAGDRFLQALKKQRIDVRAALWRYNRLFQRWQLDLVLPLAAEIGLGAASKKLGRILGHEADFTIYDVSLWFPESSYAENLRDNLKGVKNSRLNFTLLNSESQIEDGYVYFVK